MSLTFNGNWGIQWSLDHRSNYFYIENNADSIITLSITNTYKISLEYSADRESWSVFDFNKQPQLEKRGDRIYMRGNNERFCDTINATGEFNVGGDITTLLSEKGKLSDISTRNECFNSLFRASSVTDASNLMLYSDILSPGCYKYMFYGCLHLKAAPELSSTHLAEHCYEYMFQNCPLITETPELPATELQPYCYRYMFRNCKHLVSATRIYMKELSDYCCFGMFYGCESLINTPELISETAKPHCYDSMFRQCESLVKVSCINLVTLMDSCCANMFIQCSNLKEVCDLKATVPANKCYQFMFKDCILLENAPLLNIANPNLYCYNGTFRGCKSLKHIEINAKTWNTKASTQWVSGVGSKGEFIKPTELEISSNINSIPPGWTIINK